MTSSLGTMEKTKTSLLGSKIIVSSWNFADWLTVASSLTYIPFFLKLWNFYFVVIFRNMAEIKSRWKRCCQNPKFQKSENSHFVDLAILYIVHSLSAVPLRTIFGEFSNSYLLSAQSRVEWRYKIGPIAKIFRPIFFAWEDAKLIMSIQ